MRQAGERAPSMAQPGLIDSLAEAEAYLANGERHIRQQRELVAELEREGHDATAARNLLATLKTCGSNTHRTRQTDVRIGK